MDTLTAILLDVLGFGGKWGSTVSGLGQGGLISNYILLLEHIMIKEAIIVGAFVFYIFVINSLIKHIRTE